MAKQFNKQVYWGHFKTIQRDIKVTLGHRRKEHMNYLERNSQDIGKFIRALNRGNKNPFVTLPIKDSENKGLNSCLKANILASHFQNIFSPRQVTAAVPILPKEYPTIPPIKASTPGVLNLLKKNLKSKTPGPDGALKGSADAIAP